MSTSITEYSQTEAVLADLRQRYGDARYPVETHDGMRAARYARAEVRKWRTDLEAERQRIKSPALERCRLIDAEAKRITSELLRIETPIDEQIKVEEGRKQAERDAREKVEFERVAAIRARIEGIERAPLAMVGRSADDIAVTMMLLHGDRLDENAGYDEFLVEAQAVYRQTCHKLDGLHRQALDAEKQRAELAERKAEQDEIDRHERTRLAAETKARADAEAESRRKIEEQERASRARIEEQERQARLAQQARDEVARQEYQEEQEARRAKQAAADERHRAAEREKAERASARDMLRLFLDRHGERREFAAVTKAIRAYFAAQEEKRA